ncbi:MAG: arginine--tRNA ligase [Bacilli bacterium]|nr:arginine--tRNA ligase [Bacilli bacterium]
MHSKLEEILTKAFKKLDYEIEAKVIKSKENNVDFQCDNLFGLAKEYHKAPFMIGEEVVDEIKKMDDFSLYFKSVEVAKPGFINMCVSDRFINDSLRNLMDKDMLGATLEDKTIVVDYGGPNVAKPLHVGHLRTAIIGQAIYNILKFKGNKVIGDVHLGDIGTQMGQVIYAILRDFPNHDFETINFDLDYLNKVYPEISALCKEDEEVKAKCLEITKELQDGDPNYKILWQKICDISIKDIKRLYDYLNVHFDLWYGEAIAYKQFPEMMPFIEKQGIIKEDDGAKIIDVSEKDDKVQIPPLILQKSDGAYLYATSDLGTIWQREKDFHPDNIIYVVDARQSMHFVQVFRAAKKAHIYEGSLEHYGNGTVNGPDNKPYKTRDGGALKLESLIEDVKNEFISLREENKNMAKEDLDKIVNAIIKFADLQNDLTKNYIFDIKKFSEVNGKTGSYILYSYLRINKLLFESDSKLSENIYNEADRSLRLKLLEVSMVIDQAAKERKPHYIAGYLYELAVTANNFYEVNKMSEASENEKNDYNIILSYNNFVLKTLLELLGIEIPKAM